MPASRSCLRPRPTSANVRRRSESELINAARGCAIALVDAVDEAEIEALQRRIVEICTELAYRIEDARHE
jgi:hypothetical protein